MAVLRSNTTSSPKVTIKCPVLTHSGYDVETDQYYCDYKSWAYGLFALVGILLIMTPLVSVICCITKYKARKRYIRQLRRTPSGDSYGTSSDQPLIRDQTDHANSAYGAIESFSPRISVTSDGISEQPSESRDDVSVLSSKASLLPNYDQQSLDLKNSANANSSSTSQNTANPTDKDEGVLNPENVVSHYASSNIVPRNNPNSPIYAVPEEASPTIHQDPVYAVLENPNESSNAVENKPVDNSFEVNGKQIHPPPGLNGSLKNDNVDKDKHEGGSKDAGLNLLDEENPPCGPVYSILEPTKVNNSTEKENAESIEKPSSEKPGCLDRKDVASDEDKSNDKKRTDTKEEPRYMPLIFPSQKAGNTIDDNSTDVPATPETNSTVDTQRSRERTKSRADYQELLLDAITCFPADERNGCFILRDSISVPGSKALTVYHKSPDKDQEFYNFKVCFNEAGEVFLAKSALRFPGVRELLDHLHNHKHMLPCTLTKQIA